MTIVKVSSNILLGSLVSATLGIFTFERLPNPWYVQDKVQKISSFRNRLKICIDCLRIGYPLIYISGICTILRAASSVTCPFPNSFPIQMDPHSLFQTLTFLMPEWQSTSTYIHGRNHVHLDSSFYRYF
jgi:hypothetical protein